MRRILIVDDEALARSKIRRFLTDDSYVIEEAVNGADALAKIPVFKPDLIFLDIEMPGLNGLQVLQNLETRSFRIIFQTAFDEYAIQAFEENACDYLLKPFTKERFDVALAKARASIEFAEKLAKFEKSLQSKNRFLEKLSVTVAGKIKVIPAMDIDCFTSKDHYTFIHVGAEEHISDLSLSHLEARLDPAVFQRIHRNGIISVGKVKAVVKGENMEVEMQNGMKLPVSRANRSSMLAIAGQKASR